MATYTAIATAVLLTAVVLNNVCHSGWAASKGVQPTQFRRYSSAVNVYGGSTPISDGGPVNKNISSSGNPSKQDTKDSDSYDDSADDQDHEDQLDQDDPGNFFFHFLQFHPNRYNYYIWGHNKYHRHIY